MKKRDFILAGSVLGLAALTKGIWASIEENKLAETRTLKTVKKAKSFVWGKTMKEGETVTLSDDEWRSRLSKESYNVLRKEGTERAGTSELNYEKRKGEYLCAGCGLLLFTSSMKYDSGTGWPSFFEAVEGHIGIKQDTKLFYVRTEYHCKRCGGHQGHVFNDGPKPSGQRWCNNGVALEFVAT